MGDCNLSHYTSPLKHEDKLCKYSYTSWCSTCEKNSPRRRSRSETDHCRRKCKEMKTLTPKKYDKSQEYENMEFEYEIKGQWQEKDMRYECCRIRSNLCELPTSYISNNCQMTTKLPSLPKISNDYVDCLKSVTSYEQTLKFVDFNDQLEHLGSMQDKSKIGTLCKNTPSKVDHLKTGKKTELRSPSRNCFPFPQSPQRNIFTYSSSPPKNGLAPLRSPIKSLVDLSSHHQHEMHRDNHNVDIKNKYIPNYNGHWTNCLLCDHCPLVDFKLHDLSNHRSVCYDTGTYFNRKNETSNLNERYSVEVASLKEKLKVLKQEEYYFNKYDNRKTVVSSPDLINRDASEVGNKIDLEKPVENVEIKPKVKNERNRIVSPLLGKNSRSKIFLKTRARINTKSVKLRKLKPKQSSTILSESDYAESDCSGSDSENEVLLDEEPESLSEPSTDESNKTSSENAVSLVPEEIGSGDVLNWPVRPSLFPNIPPYIQFNSHDSNIELRLPNGRRYFKWKLSTITPIIVRKTLTNSGFALVRNSNQWLGTWGKHMKSPGFRTLKDTQKLNHFPGTFQLGRKDRLWRNFQRMINKFGHKEFGFLPHSYILPQELKLLKQNWEFKNGSGGEMWIIKPPASARGVGIKVINKWTHLPKKTSLVVQKYISNPYLINGSKFDLRLYVLVTSFNPLRIYLYPDGLARFASAKYSDDVKDLKDKYMHLTNYSINKLSSQYTANEDANACQGHKWTISKLLEYLHRTGADTRTLWKHLEQLVIKTMIACEPPIVELCNEYMNNTYNCYELFGVDVLLDDHLKPWLLEVNISPSLHSASPLDSHVKGPLVQTLFDMVQFHLPPKINQTFRHSPQCFEPKLYTTSLTKKERGKHARFLEFESREDYLYDVLRELTGDDVRQLARAEDEFVVKGRFERIFPTTHTYKYLNFMETRYYNRLFDAWETKYARRREDGISLLQTLCAQKVHLKVAPSSTIKKNALSTTLLDTKQPPPKEGQSRPLEDIMKEASITNKL